MPDRPIKVLHIVRQYGPVGGMEGYVWHLTRQLADIGCTVAVVCESVHGQVHPSIAITELGSIARKPRWLSMLRFSAQAQRWLAHHPHDGWLIHSHEATGFHQIITFHGPPFARIRDRGFWRRLSLRAAANLWIEKRAVCARNVRAVIPNSSLIGDMLQNYYPCIGQRMATPIVPGVETLPARDMRDIPEHGGVVGFVGKEWKRKGLDIAINIARQMRLSRPQLELHVAGPDPDDIRHLFSDWQGGYRLLGETDARPLFQNFDLLLHPARMEPFGMVITEALSAAVPAVVSNQCGAQSEVRHDRVLTLDAPVEDWSRACLSALGSPQKNYQRNWRQVAEEYCRLYERLGCLAD